MPTIKDVARLASTSVSTVSIILTGKAEERKISAETQARVRQAISELGYVPNRGAQNLRTAQRTRSVALFWANDWRSPLLARFLNGLDAGSAEADIPVEIVIQPYLSGHLGAHRALQGIPAFDGIIVGNANEQDLACLREAHPTVPCVLYNRQLDAYPWVAVDDELVGSLAATALASAAHVAVLTAQTAFAGITAREHALTCRLRQSGSTASVVPLASMTADAGYEAMRALLDGLGSDGTVDAVFAPSDTVALGVLRACRDRDLAIPADIAVAAVGNGIPEYAAYSAPALTTVEIPMEEMARRCLHLLMHEMDRGGGNAHPPTHQLLEPQLIRRASTRETPSERSERG